MEFWTVFPIVLLFILFFIRIPVAFAMLISAASYFLFGPHAMDITLMVQKMIAAMESFTYLAVPFFTCAAVVFNYAGITKHIMNLANLMVGSMRGGLAQVNIIISMLMGGLSGSANADAAMNTKMIVPQMEKLGYGRSFSCAVTTAGSCITPIIPPGIIMILYATASGTSIAQLFYAGYLPGIVMTIALMFVTYLIANKRKFKPARVGHVAVMQFIHALREAIWALFVPFGILAGLRFGIFTPTEAGAVCIVYALFVGKYIYKELTFSQVPDMIMESVYSTAGIMFILAGATAFAGYLTWERIPIMISEFMVSNISSPLVFLFVVNIMLIVVGCFFDGGAAMILIAPLLVPVAQNMGIDLIHFGMILCINLTIAGVTPPFGNMMFISTSIAKVKIEDYTKEALPYILALFIVLALVTYIPEISLLVPHLLAA